LTNPRFLGVQGEYLDEHFTAWQFLLESQERKRRHPDKPRDDVDRRDAMNLALASRNF